MKSRLRLDHDLAIAWLFSLNMIFSENRWPLFGITL